MSEQEYRVEHDTMGEVRVPAAALWGAQTQRAVENFPISGRGLERAQIRAFGLLKAAAARVNERLGVLEPDMAQAIATAADEVAEGGHDEQFPIDVFQTGSGTSSNMNANEVLATLATRTLGREVHPNDHVNASQSSNDTFPTTLRLATTEAVVHDVIPALEHLAEVLDSRAADWAELVKSGRTHLMDAVPVTLGQEFGGYAAQIRLGRERIESALPRVAQIPLGGTATGTGLNTHPEFASRVRAKLTEATGHEISAPADPFEAQGNRDALVELSGALKVVAVSLTKIAQDLALMGSGPRTGLGELALPELQKGSSIMPGKVNPVIPEVVLQVAAQVIGNDTAITIGGMQGQFELNVRVPMIARNLLHSVAILSSASKLLAEKVIDGVEAQRDVLERNAGSTPAIATALNEYIGYDKATEIVKEAVASKRTIREVAIEKGVDEETLDKALDLLPMARPHEQVTS